MKWAVRVLACLTFALLVAAGSAYLFKQDAEIDLEEPPFTVDQTDFVLSDVTPGRHELVVSIANPAKVPRQIIGLGEG